MIMFLALLVFLLMIGSFFSIIVSLAVPSAFKKLFKKNLGRKKTTLLFTGITFALFVILVILAANGSNSATEQDNAKVTVKPTSVPNITQQKKSTTQGTKNPTPVPTEDCSQSVNPQMCIRMEINREPKLEATTQLTNAGLVITNNGDVDWRLCDITIGSAENLDTAFEVSGWDIAFLAHQTTTVPWSDFAQDNGNRFNYYTTQPNDIELDCSVNHEQEHLRIN